MSGASRLPGRMLEEVRSFPQDAWGLRQARLLLRDGRVIAPVAIHPDGEIAGWGSAGPVDFEADDIVAIEPTDH